MANAYHRGKRVSLSHAAMLDAYEREHGPIYINQGRRTLAEQAGFYAHYLRYGKPLAAKPLPGAPHIKWGREHHALDINAGAVQGVAAFYRAHLIPVAFNVPGEPWHMDTLDEDALRRAAGKLDAGAEPVIRNGSTDRAAIHRLQVLLHSLHLTNVINGSYGIWTRRAVRRFQTKHGLPVDGVVGPATWRALRAATHK